MRTLQSGGLMIGASDTLCQFFLLPYLEKFHTEYPEVQLQVTNRTTPDTVELLKVGKVDIALVNLPVDDSALCVRDVLQVHDVFVASERFAHLKGRPGHHGRAFSGTFGAIRAGLQFPQIPG